MRSHWLYNFCVHTKREWILIVIVRVQRKLGHAWKPHFCVPLFFLFNVIQWTHGVDVRTCKHGPVKSLLIYHRQGPKAPNRQKIVSVYINKGACLPPWNSKVCHAY